MGKGWKECKLGDVITLHRGYDLPARERKPGTVPLVSSSGVTDHHVEAKVEGPGVVTGRYGTLGEVFFIPEDFWPLNTTLFVSDFKGNDPRFVSYFLRTVGLEAYNAAGAVPGVNRNHLHLLDVAVPPLPVQRRIAAILSAYDDLIENNNRRIAILEEMAQNLYREWFVHFRFPGHEHVKMVDSPLGPIPEGWGVKRLGDVTEYVARGISPKYDDSSSYVVLNQRCIRNGRINMDPARRQSKRVPTEKYIQNGDVLVNSTGIGTLGRVAQVYEEIADTTVDSHVTIVRPQRRINRDYFGLTLKNMEEYFEHQGFGATGQTELRSDRVNDASITLPPADIQENFSHAVSPMRSLTQTLLAKNVTLSAIREALLPKLVSGEIDIAAGQRTKELTRI